MSEIRMLDELGAELDRVARATRPRRRRRWFPALLVVLLAGVATVPATRAGIDDLAGWLAGDAGQPAGDDAPAWLHSDIRLIAESEGAKLFVARHGDQLEFAVGKGFGTSATVDSWRAQFADHKVIPLGPASVDGKPWDKRGRFPLMGVTARSVTRIDATYASGAPASVSGVQGGFVLWIQAARRLRELVAFDATGAELERVDVSRIDLSKVCFDARGCPPGNWRLAPGARRP